MIIGEVVRGKVINIFKTHILVELPNGFTGLVHITEMSDYFVSNIKNTFKIHKKYDLMVLKVDEEKKRANLSWKRITPRFQIDPFEFEIEETKNGFGNLKEFVEREINND